ncbi:fusaric acid resistance family protein [Streptomyces sp. 3211.6]|uniref:FUSC family protein n=1 Tax=Streptomyces sp. 3211.6 TaxID=1938845 RepID=UPI000EB49176|nr:FUSC family protein [Streptomyces sp. 3211.6]RKT03384.1 fusaric acid resistance family protein [Streptomyces sp. 3211.6]
MGGVPRRWLPPGYAASGVRAVRVTLVAAAGFYLFLYGFGSSVAATYALFSAVALAGLSRIPGTGPQRAATVLRLVPACWLLVVTGTFLSVRTWSAVAGMLVIGFVLAFAAVGGPWLAGAGPGLQLLYMLPSFPPYDPGSLGVRLAGTTAGLALLVLAERYLFPEPAPPPYRELAARAADAAAHCARELAEPPYALSAAAAERAREAGTGLRSLKVPEADRPAGPGARDRALTHTGLAARTLLGRLSALHDPGQSAGEVLRGVALLSERTAGRLRLRADTGPGDAYRELAAARARLAAVPAGPAGPAALRRDAAVLEVADAALTTATAASLAVGGPVVADRVQPGRFWYARTPAVLLWWHRIRGHAVRRSVFFQNAVRIGLALAAARLVAGLDTLPHGFWATLAALSLTRTTVGETWSTIRIALAGTFAGALLTAGLLTVVGPHTAVYAVVLPLWMLFAFTVGPVRGVGWAQGLFTVLVAMVFAQLAPATWQLAEVRMADVLIGSVIGGVFGLLAWPRGAHDELGRATAGLLRRAAEIVVATSASVAAGGTGEGAVAGRGYRSLRHALTMAESAYAQFQSEPVRFGAATPRPPGPDWQAALMTGHHVLWGADRLTAPPDRPAPPDGLGTGPAGPAPLGPEAAEGLTGIGDRVAGRMLLVSAHLDPGGDTPPVPAPLRDPAYRGLTAEPPGAPRRYYAAASWLDSLMADLERVTAPEGGTR